LATFLAILVIFHLRENRQFGAFENLWRYLDIFPKTKNPILAIVAIFYVTKTPNWRFWLFSMGANTFFGDFTYFASKKIANLVILRFFSCATLCSLWFERRQFGDFGDSLMRKMGNTIFWLFSLKVKNPILKIVAIFYMTITPNWRFWLFSMRANTFFGDCR